MVSFRLVYDRDNGKPKGYGFCEYKDQETALSAMRNLNGHELNGRALRVDNAASEKSKEELKSKLLLKSEKQIKKLKSFHLFDKVYAGFFPGGTGVPQLVKI